MGGSGLVTEASLHIKYAGVHLLPVEWAVFITIN